MYVLATIDCYRPFIGKPGVWERDVTYSAWQVYDDGKQRDITNDASTVIKETLSYISGQQPPASQSRSGQPFFDAISVGNGSDFTLTQTFSVIFQGVSYAAQIQSLTGKVSPSNLINAHKGYVDINEDPNLGGGGAHPPCGS